jgi:hypothetical protein
MMITIIPLTNRQVKKRKSVFQMVIRATSLTSRRKKYREEKIAGKNRREK